MEPPLSPSGPRSGLVDGWSPDATRLQLPSESMFQPSDVTPGLQSKPGLFAKMELLTETEWPPGPT